MLFEKYKKEITIARNFKQIGVLFLIYEAVKADFYNDKITANEYCVLTKMIVGL